MLVLVVVIIIIVVKAEAELEVGGKDEEPRSRNRKKAQKVSRIVLVKFRRAHRESFSNGCVSDCSAYFQSRMRPMLTKCICMCVCVHH